MKKWYKVTFYAEMDEADIKAMNGSFYSAIEESMEIGPCEGLQIEEDTIGANDEPLTCLNLEDDDYVLDVDGNIQIDTYVYDAFVPNGIIDVRFLDEDNSRARYKMIKEDDNFIYAEYICKVEEDY